MGTYFWIGLGGALGSMGRHWSNGLVARLAGLEFPWGTLVINIVGSFLIGVAAATMGSEGRFDSGPTAQQFVMVGICGGYTTFSAFSLQTLALIQGHQWNLAALNIILSVVACLGAVWVGYMAGTFLNAG